MAATDSPRGLIIDLITPLKKDGEIDGRSLGRMLDRVLPCIQGIFLSSPYMGQGTVLTDLQREDLFEKTLVVVRGRAPILTWITGKDTQDTEKIRLRLEKRKEIRKYTGPLFWVDTPLYYHSNRGLFEHYRRLSSAPGAPFVLHNDPELIQGISRPLKRNNLRTSILKELATLPRIKGLIFLGSLDRARHYQRAVRRRTDFRMYDGDESQFLDYPSRSGLVSAGANLAPKAWNKITAASLNMPGSEKKYPDQLQQLWETGKFLRSMFDMYRGRDLLFMQQALAETGLIESPEGLPGGEKGREDLAPLIALMKKYEDPA
ncbi:MAG: dihydrodipicolinate synthase family protein [Pseudomonadota bacterium]